MKKIKFSYSKLLLILLVSVLCVINVLLLQHNKILDLDKVALSYMETVSSNIQRISKLELENNSDDTLIDEVDAICAEILPNYDDGEVKSFEESSEMTILVNSIIDEWGAFKNTLSYYRETGDRDALFEASEQNYNLSATSLDKLHTYVTEYSEKVDGMQQVMVVDIVLIGMVILRILMTTHKELQENKKLSEEMYIDTATGVYNRAKCQEIMKTPSLSADNVKDRAVVIFDLNDLKKTNDNLGHRAGDELIYNFATQVKKATEIFSNDIFVGRYGGDEFVAFLDEIEERDVLDYIKEVEHLLQTFNHTENKGYNLSSAMGYGITTADTKTMSVKELFDIADNNMYTNKIAMKEKKKQELLAQGIQVAEEVDDRL